MIILFLLAVLIDFILISFLIENDEPSPFWSLLLIGLGIVGYYFLVDKIDFYGVIEYARLNIEAVLFYVGSYIGLGVLWSFFRWYIYLLKIRDLRREATPEEIKEGHLNGKYTYSGNYISIKIPTAKNHKGRITQWMAYWPFSLFGTFCKNFLARLFTNLHKLFSGVFDKISASVFADEKLKTSKKIEVTKKA